MSTSRRAAARPDENRRATAFVENLFLTLTAVYLLYSFKGLTMFKPVIPEAFISNLKLAMELTVLARLILRRRRNPEIWLGLILTGIYAQTYLTMKDSKILFIGIMAMGLEGIDYRKILRIYFATVGGALIATVIAGLAGGIPNIVYVREGLRSCWGTAYPTDFSAVVLFLAMAMWIAWPKLPDWAMLIFGLIPLAQAVFITASRNGLICGVLFELAICYRWIERALLESPGKRDKGRLMGAIDALLTLAEPICATAAFLLVYLYVKNPEAMGRVDVLLSERLSLSARGVQQYGVTAFGTRFAMNGGRGATVFPKGEFFFLDCSYFNILLRYGWVTMLAMSAAWVWMTRKAIRGGNRRMALVMAVVAVHSIMEHHFADVFHNILLVMPLAALRVKAREEAREQARRRCVAFAAVAAALVVLGALCLPGMMSGLRTIYAAKGWQGGGENAWPVLCLNLALVATVAAGAWALYRLLCGALTRRRFEWAAAAVLALCLCLGVGAGAWGNRVIAGAAVDNAAMVDADAGALSCLSKFDIYVDAMPEVYRQRYDNVRRTVLGGDELARIPGATVLMDKRPEHRLFIDRGYKFVQISDAHALYVTQPEALAALEAGGYAPSDYYDAVTEVDMEALAAQNGLEMKPEGLVLESAKESLLKGPGDDLFYAPRYIVEYSLFLPEAAADAEGEICLLRVRNSNISDIASTVVTRDQFDAQGRATIQLPFALNGDTIAVEFQAIAKKNRQVGVTGIRYWQAKD